MGLVIGSSIAIKDTKAETQQCCSLTTLIATMSFWTKLAKPIYCVAPMANVTDVAFRRIITDLAKPTVNKPFCRRERCSTGWLCGVH